MTTKCKINFILKFDITKTRKDNFLINTFKCTIIKSNELFFRIKLFFKIFKFIFKNI